MVTITRTIIKFETYQVRGSREEAAKIVEQIKEDEITYGDWRLTLIDTAYGDEAVKLNNE